MMGNTERNLRAVRIGQVDGHPPYPVGPVPLMGRRVYGGGDVGGERSLPNVVGHTHDREGRLTGPDPDLSADGRSLAEE